MEYVKIEAYALEKYPVNIKMNKTEKGEYDANFPRRKAFIEGFKLGFSMNKLIDRR